MAYDSSSQQEVHFGSQLHVSVQEIIEDFSDSQFDDTLPINEKCPENLSMDSVNSQEEFDEVDFCNGLWSEKENTSDNNGESDSSPIKIGSYEDFLKGTKKRLYSQDTLADIEMNYTSSPECKKVRFPDPDLFDHRCSTPEDQTTEKDEESKIVTFTKSLDDAKLLWSISSSLTTSSNNDGNESTSESEVELSPPTVSFGVSLAHEILKENLGDEIEEKPQLINKTISKHDFKDDAAYRKYIFVRTKSDPVPPRNLPQNEVLPMKEDTKSCSRRSIQEDVNLFLMPEIEEEEKQVYGDKETIIRSTRTLHEEKNLNVNHPQLSVNHQQLPLEQYQEDNDKDEARFKKALAYTQDDEIDKVDIEKISNGFESDSKVSRILDLFAAQSPDVMEELENTSEDYGVNRMLSELMVSQAIRGTQGEHDRYRYTRTDTRFLSSDEGVVPQIDNDEWLENDDAFHEDDGYFKEDKRSKYTHQQDQPNTSNGKETKAFKWKHNAEDDSVVPNMSRENFDSPITTPQKLRLGLSKKIKVRRILHPYKK